MTQLDHTRQQREKASVSFLLFLGVILVGANLRVPLTSVGALIPFIRDDLGITNATAGLITTLPLLAFALFSPIAPKIANRIGMEWTIGLSLVLLFIGIVMRSIPGVKLLFLGTLFIGLAIAVGNVLIPAIVKINFPLKIGLMTGIYAIVMNVFGAFGSGFTVPISTIGSLGWRGSLAVWGVLTCIALLVWLPQLMKKRQVEEVKVEKDSRMPLWRSSLAWKITIFMGSQSLMFYTLITWLPDILQAQQYDANKAGWIVFLMQLALIPFTFITPIVAEKVSNQVGLSISVASLFVLGVVGLLVGIPFFIPIAAILLGIACGSAFSLAMMFFTLRTNDGSEAAELSGMAQSLGYLLAAFGPVLVGGLHDLVRGWTVPLLLLIFFSFVIMYTGVESGKKGKVSH